MMYKKEEVDLMAYAVVLAIFTVHTLYMDGTQDSYLFLIGYLTGIDCY